METTLTASLVETTGEVPSPRSFHQGVLANGRLIVWGGSCSNGESPASTDNSTYSLNMATRHWTKLDIQPAPEARFLHSACLCGNKLVVFGGVQQWPVNDLWSLDIDLFEQGNPAWERIEVASGSPSPSPRAGHVMVSYENQLYIFGGGELEIKDIDIWRFDMSTRTWTEFSGLGNVPPCRALRSVTLVGDAVFISGGKTSNQGALGDMWVFKINEWKWYRFPELHSQPSASFGYTMSTVEERIFLIGGLVKLNQFASAMTVYGLNTNLIDFPEGGSVITVKLAPTIGRLRDPSMDSSGGEKGLEIGPSEGPGLIVEGPVAEGPRARSSGSQIDEGATSIAEGVENIRMDSLGTGPDETDPYLGQDPDIIPITLNAITGTM
ncbi:unnamed protein product, partial [Rhizoctonia solani]